MHIVRLERQAASRLSRLRRRLFTDLDGDDAVGTMVDVEEKIVPVRTGEVCSGEEAFAGTLEDPATPIPLPVRQENETDTAILEVWNESTRRMESAAQEENEPETVIQEVWNESTAQMESATLESDEQDTSILHVWDESTAYVEGLSQQETVVTVGARFSAPKETLKVNTALEPPKSKRGVAGILGTWFYRCWLLCATGALTLLLLRIQSVLDHVPVQMSLWRHDVQWAELTWLTPVPLAIFLWIGWFLFAAMVDPDPVPIRAPWIAQRQGLLTRTSAKPVRLVFRFVTRGDNVEVLRDSILAVHQAIARYLQTPGPYDIEIVSDRPLSLDLEANERIYVVPPDYVSKKQSRFKARALAYLQEQSRPQREDWHIYLDEESIIGEKLVAGIYNFIWQAMQADITAKKAGKKRKIAGWIGQGAILYQGGNWFFRGADALRTADDFGRFRLQYALGVPVFGIHGSFIVVRGIDEARLSFDVGSANSITEDAAWALRAWAQGFRFKWVDSYVHEQPPQHFMDFVRQRSRWLVGLRLVLRDKTVPLRYRLCLGIFTGLWQLGFLPFLIAFLALFIHASPYLWMRLPADFAWATFILAYLQGIDAQAKHTSPLIQGKYSTMKRILSWLLVLCSIWYALLEALAVLYSFRPKQGFFVISKPSFARKEKDKERV